MYSESLEDSDWSLDDSEQALDPSQQACDDSEQSLDDSEQSQDDSEKALDDSEFVELLRGCSCPATFTLRSGCTHISRVWCRRGGNADRRGPPFGAIDARSGKCRGDVRDGRRGRIPCC